jgi:type III restriction enzyme
VQAKRKAAEGVVHRLIGEDSFKGQKWGYLVAYEESIKSADSWDDLKAVSEPISNA